MKKTINIDQKLHKELKMQSAKSGETISQLAEQAIKKLVRDLK